MTGLSLATTLSRNPGVLARKVKPDDPALVLLNPKSGEYFTLEAIGTQVWELCDGKRTVGDIVALLKEEYDESADVIEQDVFELCRELLDEALVVPAS